jgi:hypothetical protein
LPENDVDTQNVGSLVAIAIFLAARVASSQPQDATRETVAGRPAEPASPANSPTPATEGPSTAVNPVSPLSGRWQTTIYGFAELDVMHDTTQSFGPASNNAMLARPGTYAAAHGRTQIAANNSQFGFKFAAPEFQRMRARGQVEADFFGVLPTDVTEQNLFASPALRMRLFYLALETPLVDVLAGQYHDLFAWGGAGFYPNTVAFLGVPGQIYHRQPQVRLSKTVEGKDARFDIAIAATRPAQRDAEIPDIQAGLRLALNGWKGASSQGFGQPDLAALALGVSGVARRFAVAEFITAPGGPKKASGWGLAVNAFVPVIPRDSAENRGNALSLTAELTVGSGISDLYTGLTGGALFPTLPNPGSLQPPPLYRPNIDSGIVTYDANGNLKAVEWQAFVVGLQYYLPIDRGRVWVSGTYSRVKSGNIASLTPVASRGGVFTQADYIDGNVFVTVTPAVQLGLSYQGTHQVFGDNPFGGSNPSSRNHRVEGAARFFF